jgi:hypothetical protein
VIGSRISSTHAWTCPCENQQFSCLACLMHGELMMANSISLANVKIMSSKDQCVAQINYGNYSNTSSFMYGNYYISNIFSQSWKLHIGMWWLMHRKFKGMLFFTLKIFFQIMSKLSCMSPKISSLRSDSIVMKRSCFIVPNRDMLLERKQTWGQKGWWTYLKHFWSQ